MADFDNDGYRDVIITNGFPRDVTDRDFANFRAGPAGGVASPMMMHGLYSDRQNLELRLPQPGQPHFC